MNAVRWKGALSLTPMARHTWLNADKQSIAVVYHHICDHIQKGDLVFHIHNCLITQSDTWWLQSPYLKTVSRHIRTYSKKINRKQHGETYIRSQCRYWIITSFRDNRNAVVTNWRIRGEKVAIWIRKTKEKKEQIRYRPSPRISEITLSQRIAILGKYPDNHLKPFPERAISGMDVSRMFMNASPNIYRLNNHQGPLTRDD